MKPGREKHVLPATYEYEIYKERLAIKQRFLSAKKSQRQETTVKEFLENLQSYPKHNTVLQYNPF